jgi:hypothetical protein
MKPAAKSSKPEEVRLSVSCLVCGRVVPAFTALSEAEVAELRPAILREYRVREDGASGEKKRPRGRLDFRLNEIRYGDDIRLPENEIAEEMEREATENVTLRSAVTQGQLDHAASVAWQQAEQRAAASRAAEITEAAMAESESRGADANWEGGFRDPDEKTSGPIDPQAGHDKAAAPSPKPRPKPKLKARRKQK